MPRPHTIPSPLITLGLVLLVGLIAVAAIMWRGTPVTVSDTSLVGQPTATVPGTASYVKTLLTSAQVGIDDIRSDHMFWSVTYLDDGSIVLGGLAPNKKGMYLLSPDGTYKGAANVPRDMGLGECDGQCKIATALAPAGSYIVRDGGGSYGNRPSLVYRVTPTGFAFVARLFDYDPDDDDARYPKISTPVVLGDTVLFIKNDEGHTTTPLTVETVPATIAAYRLPTLTPLWETSAMTAGFPAGSVGEHFITVKHVKTSQTPVRWDATLVAYTLTNNGLSESDSIPLGTGVVMNKYNDDIILKDAIDPDVFGVVVNRLNQRYELIRFRLEDGSFTRIDERTFTAPADAILGDYVAMGLGAVPPRIFKGTQELQVTHDPSMIGPASSMPLGIRWIGPYSRGMEFNDKGELVIAASSHALLYRIDGFTPELPTETGETPHIFIDDRDTPGVYELYSETSAGVIKLSVPLSPTGRVWMFNITPDGQRVVYTADDAAVTDERNELFVVPITGGPSTKLSGPAHSSDRPQANVIRFIISPDSQRVAYAADPNTWSMYELYTVPIAGGPVRVSHALPADHDVDDFKFSPDSQRVVYRAGRTAIGKWELYSVPSAGGSQVRISQQWTSSSYINVAQDKFTTTCDSQTVYYLADTFADGSRDELYSVPITGGAITPHPEHQLPTFTCSAPPPSQCKSTGAACVGYAECCSQTCSAGACIAIGGTPPPTSCTDECTAGAPQCAGASVRTCGNYDSDTCLEWRTSACGTGTSCQGGTCVATGNSCNQQPRTRCSDEPVTGATRISAACPACTISPCPPAGTPPPKCYQCPEGQEPVYDYATRTASCQATAQGLKAPAGTSAAFTAESATCTIAPGDAYCLTSVSWTSTGTGKIQLWRADTKMLTCVNAGEPATKYLSATTTAREYRLYPATACEAASADLSAPLDTITVTGTQ